MFEAIAIIGTAGRDKTEKYTRPLWEAMLKHARTKFVPWKEYHLISGGAAWADHLAVELFLEAPSQFSLSLYLPAPLTSQGEFLGPRRSSGATSNNYHEKFMKITGVNARRRILEAQEKGLRYHKSPRPLALEPCSHVTKR